jgi:glycosyltransferase 2 family protein
MKKFFSRTSLLIVILAIFVYYIGKNYSIIERTIHVTLSQSLGFLLLSALFCALAYYFMALMNKSIFGMMGVRRTTFQMVILQMSSLAVNVLVPSAGVSVGIMFAGDAKDRGESEAAAVTAVILALLVDYISIASLLTFGMIYLLLLGSLSLTFIIPAIAFYGLTVGLYLLIYFAGKNKSVVMRFLNWLTTGVNRILVLFKKKKILQNKGVISNFVNELENAYVSIAKDRVDFTKSIGIIFLSHLMYLAAIYVIFISLGFTPLLRVLITGYAIGMMFVVISPTPNGVGFVEGSMALAYASLGISGVTAASVALIYRGFSFWLPLIIGFIAIQRKHLLGLVAQRND